MKRALALIASAALAGCTTVGPEIPAPSASAPAVPPAMQWLYGSGEGAAASLQAYRAFRDHVLAAARSRPEHGVVLSAQSSLASPTFRPCGDRPLAVMLDVDETLIQNLGYEYDEAALGRSYDAAIWDRWEQTGADLVEPMPGAVETLRAVRAAGITVIFNSNRLAANAAATEAAITGAGLGPARHGETLFLKNDFEGGSAKDSRRAHVAERFCVIAMAGDQLGDFSDLFNADHLDVVQRRRAVQAEPFASLWGKGWFLFSNPVYGPGISGTLDQVFPADRRWSSSEGAN